ncbi:hypothetical protein QLX08_008349 [Tetragonisca angustula]|uniref:Uncharacterized protein n=1 Tax=Tetragonisca angustula TaxID=166442 RepID=A0AAW0ZKK8_9HYME
MTKRIGLVGTEFGQGLSCLRRRGKPILCARLTTDYTQAYSEKKIATLTMKESRRKKHLETSSYASSLLLSTTGNRVRSFTLWMIHIELVHSNRATCTYVQRT